MIYVITCQVLDTPLEYRQAISQQVLDNSGWLEYFYYTIARMTRYMTTPNRFGVGIGVGALLWTGSTERLG